MANPVIKVKRSSVEGKVPAPNQLERGELAVNSYDGKVYIVKDQFSVGIATTTTTVNPWLETGIGVGLSYSGDIKVSGISTFGSDKVVVGAAQTQFLVRGNGRVVGVLTVGSGSVTLNDDSVNVGAGTTILTTGFQIGGNGVFVHSTGYNVGGTFLHNAGITGAGANLSGIVTAVGLDVSGNIDIDGTTNLDAVDIDGAVDMASSLTLAGNADFNGNLDVDGTTNLDAVDIDGAVDMASTLVVTGNSTFTGKVFANHGVQGNINSTGVSTISGFTFPSSDGSEDQALVTNGNGTFSFKDMTRIGAGTTISTGVTTATQGQTSFTAPNVFNDGSSEFSTQVFLNGVKQRVGASNDFQLSAPSTVNFNTGVNAGDDISIVLYFGHTLEEELFTATQGQKDFNLSGNIAASKNYKVFLNGVRLRNTVDYIASSAVVLTQAARAGENIDIVSDQAEDRLTAVESQTSFAPSDSNTTADNLQVYMNGILLRETEDWSIGSPSITILDANGLTAGDQLDVVVRRS